MPASCASRLLCCVLVQLVARQGELTEQKKGLEEQLADVQEQVRVGMLGGGGCTGRPVVVLLSGPLLLLVARGWGYAISVNCCSSPPPDTSAEYVQCNAKL